MEIPNKVFEEFTEMLNDLNDCCQLLIEICSRLEKNDKKKMSRKKENNNGYES